MDYCLYFKVCGYDKIEMRLRLQSKYSYRHESFHCTPCSNNSKSRCCCSYLLL